MDACAKMQVGTTGCMSHMCAETGVPNRTFHGGFQFRPTPTHQMHSTKKALLAEREKQGITKVDLN